jgi:hypothetical protein
MLRFDSEYGNTFDLCEDVDNHQSGGLELCTAPSPTLYTNVTPYSDENNISLPLFSESVDFTS